MSAAGAGRASAGGLRQKLAPLLVFLAGVVLSIPYNVFPAQQQLDLASDTVDMAWYLDLPTRLARGEWAGRDFIFTYGPLYQLTHAFGLLMPPHDLASLLRFFWFPDAIITLLLVWFALRLTGAPLAWRAAGYLLWVFFFPPLNMPPTYYTVEYGLKPLAGLLVPVCCLLLLARPRARGERDPSSAGWPGLMTLLLWGSVGPVLLLYSLDLGVTSLGALVASAVTVIVVTMFQARGARGTGSEARVRALWAAGAVAVGLAVFAAALLLFGWGDYIRLSREVTAGYTAKMADAGKASYFAALIAVILAGLLTLAFSAFRLRGALKSGDAAAARRTLALLGLSWFCLGWARGGLTRSDYGHILMAAAPTLFLVGSFLPCYLRAEGRRLAGLAFVGALALMLSTPFGWPHQLLFRTHLVAGAVYRVAAVRKLEFKPARLEVIPESQRGEIEAARALPGESLFAWPDEAYLNVIAGKANPVFTVQSYAALTDKLEQETVRRLRTVPGLHVIMLTSLPPLSGVESLTRTPIISRYLLENFELAAPPAETFATLRPSAGRAWREDELAVAPQAFAPGDGRSLTLGLDNESARDLRASDLLLIRLRASKTLTLGVFKPGRHTVTFVLSDGSERTQTFLLPQDGESHDFLVSAATFGKDPLLVSLFSPTKIWKSRERLVGLRFGWEPIDGLSATPREITLERVATFRREAAVALETPLDKASQVPLRASLYAD